MHVNAPVAAARRRCSPATSRSSTGCSPRSPTTASRARRELFARDRPVSNAGERAVPRPARRSARARRAQDRPHRHRHALGVRPPAALRPRRQLPAAHHQEAAPQVDPLRAALVPARRHQREMAAGARRHASGTNGPTRTASSARSTATSGATGARPDGGEIDQIANVIESSENQARFAPPHRQRLEPRRRRPHGAAAVPRAVPVLRRRRQALLPDVPAQRRPLPRRALQHRLLRRCSP